ncbi:hypothetical protein HRbin27_00216 [bacterium HR27]|nr:hypothetical protein HRbin27_00216 [bacterium HR27]
MPRCTEEVGVDRQHLLDHPVHDVAHLVRDVQLVRQRVVSKQREGVDRVIQVSRRGEREHVARDLLGPALDGRLHALLHIGALAPRPRGEDRRVAGSDIRREELDQTPVPRERPLHRCPVELRERLGQVRRHHGRTGHLAIALRDLLGVVERVVMEERPDRQSRDTVEHEDEVRVLERRVMPGCEEVRVERRCALPAGSASGVAVAGEQLEHPLDRGGPGPITRPGRGDGEREGMFRRFAPHQSDDWWWRLEGKLDLA